MSALPLPHAGLLRPAWEDRATRVCALQRHTRNLSRERSGAEGHEEPRKGEERGGESGESGKGGESETGEASPEEPRAGGQDTGRPTSHALTRLVVPQAYPRYFSIFRLSDFATYYWVLYYTMPIFLSHPPCPNIKLVSVPTDVWSTTSTVPLQKRFPSALCPFHLLALFLLFIFTSTLRIIILEILRPLLRVRVRVGARQRSCTVQDSNSGIAVLRLRGSSGRSRKSVPDASALDLTCHCT